MPACYECHNAKVRCDRPEGATSCSRCTRLGVECIERPSRQGQGPKKRKRKLLSPPTQATPQENKASTNEVTGSLASASQKSSEADNILQGLTTAPPTMAKLHYGIRYLVHSWSSFALTRRSFALLERASALAHKCGVPMDEVFCSARREVILPILFGNTKAEGPRDEFPNNPLQWRNLPSALRSLCRLDRLENRYIFVREAINGHSRFLASDTFQQDIVSLWLIEQTWKANEKPVVQLFLEGTSDFDKFTKAIHFQMSRYSHPDKAPECVRMNDLRVRFHQQGRNSSVSMDLLYSFEIVTLEHSFYVLELVHSTRSPPSVPTQPNELNRDSASPDETQDESSTEPLDLDVALRLFEDLAPLDESDADFEAFLALIND